MNFSGDVFVWEMLGTAALVLFGVGVCANVVLSKTLGHNGGWLLIAFGWGFAVFVGASIAQPSGAHINPAVTFGLAVADKMKWGDTPPYFTGQLVGGVIGAVVCWLVYKLQFDAQTEKINTLSIFSTGPTVRNYFWNVVTEIVGTFSLVLWILLNPKANAALGYAAVAFVVIGIGASLGGPTGYAINPARDLGPRIAHALLPIKGKSSSDWAYAWVPVVGPLLGAAAAGGLFHILPS